jgi:hypothetical protein
MLSWQTVSQHPRATGHVDKPQNCEWRINHARGKLKDHNCEWQPATDQSIQPADRS